MKKKKLPKQAHELIRKPISSKGVIVFKDRKKELTRKAKHDKIAYNE